MIELPEVYVLTDQINQTLRGKTIHSVKANAHPHSFAYYSGVHSAYDGMLSGHKITKANTDSEAGNCSWVEILCGDMLLSISTPIKYHAPGEKLPKSHQLLIEFEDNSHMSCTVQMWGSMLCVPLSEKPGYEQVPSPLMDDFDEAYFDGLINEVKPNMSAKAFLATEQRIPGLGNGVLQDILWNARIHPKKKLNTMDDGDRERLFRSVKSTLKEMRDCGGRDTEKDLYNQSGGYRTILSKKTVAHPCRGCGSGLVRQSFLGGNIYFCPACQPV